jgi:RsiW-degrading membrane proteinase PrsW (M82 family)
MDNSLLIFIKSNPIIFAGVFGIIPAIVWLWFWLKEDIHPEPTKLIIFCFLGGMLSVFVALPLQHAAQNLTSNITLLFLMWAFIEEALKLGSAWMGGIHTTDDDEPVDAVIYMIVAALGFVAMENTLFLIDPLISGNLTNTLITDNLRFIGATLLHVISSATIGIFFALSFNKIKKWKIIYPICGLILATILHTLFNLFIMNSENSNIFFIFGSVWVAIIFLMLLLEKIKSIRVDAQHIQ